MKTATANQVIGRGAFSTAYRQGSNKVLVHSVCNAKRCLAEWGFGGSTMFPKIEMMSYDNLKEKSVYSMPFYEVGSKIEGGLLGNLNPRHKEIYRYLRKMDVSPVYEGMSHKANTWKTLDKLTETFATAGRKFRELKCLNEALDSLRSYGDEIRFEISPRNVAVKNGKLILLDCFFFIDQLRDMKK